MEQCVALTRDLQRDEDYCLQTIEIESCTTLKFTTIDVDQETEEKQDQKQDQRSIPLDNILAMNLSDSNCRLIIYDKSNETEYEIIACSLVIIQIVLNLKESVARDTSEHRLKHILDEQLQLIHSEITHDLSEIVENVYFNLTHPTVPAIDEEGSDHNQNFDCLHCITQIIKLNGYLNGLWINIINYDSIKGDRTRIYMINNLTNDIHEWCIAFTSKYLKLPSRFTDQILPLLMNTLQSISYIKYKIQVISEQNQNNENLTSAFSKNRELLKTDACLIVENAFDWICDKMKDNQSQQIRDVLVTTELVDSILDSLKTHQNSFMEIVNKYLYFKDENWSDAIVFRILLKPFSDFVSSKIQTFYNKSVRDPLAESVSKLDLNSPQIMQRSDPWQPKDQQEKVDTFVNKSRNIFSWFIKNCNKDKDFRLRMQVERLEARGFDVFISTEMHNLSDKLDEIEEAINSEEMNDLSECCYDEEDHCYYGTSLIFVINIMDPIMGQIKTLPMQQHHILQLAEFFTSTAAHYVISITTEINKHNTLGNDASKIVIADKLFILIGTLYKFHNVLKQYLSNVNIVQKYNECKYRSRSSSLIRGQLTGTIHDKLNCRTIFTLIYTTLDETAKKLAIEISHKLLLNQRIIGIIWKQPINEPYSNVELEGFMRKYIWNQIVPQIKQVEEKTTKEFFSAFCFEIHRSMLCNMKACLTPLAVSDVLSFVQVLRVKYAFNSVIQYMITWGVDVNEIYATRQFIIINEMIQILLYDLKSLRETLSTKMQNISKDESQMEICNAIRLVIQARSGTTRTVSSNTFFNFRRKRKKSQRKK
eukprot:210262_1